MSEPSRCSTGLRGALLCGLLLGLGPLGPATAQDVDVESGAVNPRDAGPRLRERNREGMHPGIPLDIVGLEQGDNDFRSRTPALAKSDKRTAQVDPEENYRRRLAAYSLGGAFNKPLHNALVTPSDPARNPVRNNGAPTPDPRATAPQPQPASDALRLVLGSAALFIGLAICLFFWMRRRAGPLFITAAE